jgi:hypothetical protein
MSTAAIAMNGLHESEFFDIRSESVEETFRVFFAKSASATETMSRRVVAIMSARPWAGGRRRCELLTIRHRGIEAAAYIEVCDR